MQVLAGDDQDLVLHIYAAGSEIDATINQQTKTQIAATSEEQIDTAEEDDPAFYGSGNDTDSDIGAVLGGLDNSTTNGTTDGATNSATNGATTSATSATNGATSAPVLSSASVVKTSLTFNYVACESDSTTARTLSSLSWAGTGLTVERCAAYCAEYKYMGVEFGSQ